MSLRGILIATQVLAITSAIASPSLPTAAQRSLDAYVAAFNSYDCAAVLMQASPIFTELLNGSAEGKQAYCTFLQELRRDTVICPPGQVAASASEGPYRLFFVETVCSARTPTHYPSPDISGFYVLHSGDSGKTWSVLDQTCQPERLISKAYPPYKGEPALPATRVYMPPWSTR